MSSAAYVRVLDAGRIAIYSGASTEVLACDDVLLAQSKGNATLIVTRHGAHKVRMTLQRVVAGLAPVGFIRIHRSVAVNGAKVRRLIRLGTRQLAVVLDDGSRLDVGRQFQRAVRVQFGAGEPSTALHLNE